ncbi:restriction endonuclease subunit S [Nonomuraea sp. NPDC003560]|uniref:restriction endonuclease subunit S n=1 Tax=Nonomuraea sp. NPDC003560 TaxID=3364341 RepID=UPI0036766637
MPRVMDLFVVHYGHSLELNRLEKDTGPRAIAFVSRTARNNGVSARVKRIDSLAPAPAGALSVSLGGRNYALETSLQVNPFYCGRDVSYLLPKYDMSVKEKLWWAACIRANRYRFNYGRQANKTLPHLVLPDEVPEWVEKSKLPVFDRQSAGVTHNDLALDVASWKEFRFSDIFTLVRGIRYIRRELAEGATPYIRATADKNGVSQYVDLPPNSPGGLITVSSNGSVGEAFYQPEPFVASDDVVVLHPNEPISEAACMFLCTVIRTEKYRYNYGRKWFTARMRESVIKLPVTSSGSPDWEFMESYIRSLPISSLALSDNIPPSLSARG